MRAKTSVFESSNSRNVQKRAFESYVDRHFVLSSFTNSWARHWPFQGGVTITLPARPPAGLPLSHTSSPPTNTFSMPAGSTAGSPNVDRSMTVRALNRTTSAIAPASMRPRSFSITCAAVPDDLNEEIDRRHLLIFGDGVEGAELVLRMAGMADDQDVRRAADVG